MNITPILTDDATLAPENERRPSVTTQEECLDDRPAPPGTRRLGSRYRTEELAKRAKQERELQGEPGELSPAAAAQVYASGEGFSLGDTASSSISLLATTSTALISPSASAASSFAVRRKSSYRSGGEPAPGVSPRLGGTSFPIVDEHRAAGSDWDASEIMRKRRELQLVISNLPKIAAIYRTEAVETPRAKHKTALALELDAFESAAMECVLKRDKQRALLAWRLYVRSEKRKRQSRSVSRDMTPEYSAKLEAAASAGLRVQPRVRSFERFDAAKSKRADLAQQRREALSRSRKALEPARASSSSGAAEPEAASPPPTEAAAAPSNQVGALGVHDEEEEPVSQHANEDSIVFPPGSPGQLAPGKGEAVERRRSAAALSPKKRPWFFARLFSTTTTKPKPPPRRIASSRIKSEEMTSVEESKVISQGETQTREV